MLSLDNTPVYTDFGSLTKLKQGAREQSPAAIKKVAEQFESLFVNMMLKTMRQAKLAEGMLDSQQSEFCRDMYDQQLAVQISAKPGMGIADFIIKQLSPKTTTDEKKLQLGDYLQQADLANAIDQRNANDGTSASGMQTAMEACGLSNLEKSLARLAKSQQALTEHWQAQDDEWQLLKLDSDQQISSKLDFINQLLPHAQLAASALGVDANILLAQAALETGWGQALVKNNQGESSFNLFNIKADKSWQGKQARTVTLEFDGAIPRKEVAGFRAYTSYHESFADYVNFIKSNPRYSEALKNAGNATQYIRELQQAGYATDPKYAEKIISIYNSKPSEQLKAISNNSPGRG